MNSKLKYDLIIVGAGASGTMAAIAAARDGKNVLILEKLAEPCAKLKATGGGRCNLTNTLSGEEFIKRFGRDGKFMTSTLKAFDHEDLINFFVSIGVKTAALDGFRVFPATHNSKTVSSALEAELTRLGVTVHFSEGVVKLDRDEDQIIGVSTASASYLTTKVVIATGGLGYPQLGASGDGYSLAKSVGHKVTDLFPAMLPLTTKEAWVRSCRADTIGKAEIRVNLPKEKKLHAKGDLIFTKTGIRGPVVLDFAREITPLLKKYGEVPILVNLTGGKNEEQIRVCMKEEMQKLPHGVISEHLAGFLPGPLALAICRVAETDPNLRFNKLSGEQREKLIKTLVWTPLTITEHTGYGLAMITRGGVSLKEINPATLESKLVKGLFFCGEVVDLDGPCGGFNLQWAFSSGYLAGKTINP